MASQAIIDALTKQILAQGTKGWSGEGFGSAEANAKNMAEILAGIGITDIRQFGQFETTVNKQQTVYPEYRTIDEGDSTRSVPTGRYYIPQYSLSGDNEVMTGKEYVDPAYVTKANSISGDNEVTTYTASIPTKQTVYGNKVTGQVVPSTYGERQTGNAWGGTFAGKGNTGYRVEFAPDGTPVFYTTGASSKDSFLSDISPLLSIGLGFALPGVGAAIGSALGAGTGLAANALGNAVIGGLMAEAQGGDFLKGALTSAAGSALGAATAPVTSAVSEAVGSQALGQALTSGALAELQGGDFLQGAIQGGISGGINDAKLALATDQLNSMEGGFGPYESNLPTELDVIAAFPELAPPPVFDTSFTPDYSLATGAPVIPDMGAQGIQVPTINELVDVVGQPVDYSLPIPNSGLGLQMPTAPNLDSMGGGQGLVIPVDGGVITEAGFIPDAYVPDLGDPNSFINQPAPNVEVNIPDLPAEQPKDISGELAALDLVKALAPFAVTAALAKDQPQATTDEQTGYPILPIPSEWKAPEYNMAFTPSAALDFGSPDLLQGTQWANQQVQPAQMNYSLSDVMNTLNYQSVPFVQQQMQPFKQSFSVPDILQQFQTKPNVGMNDIIGGLNGRQVSISDIISGIQSQYGQKAAS